MSPDTGTATTAAEKKGDDTNGNPESENKNGEAADKDVAANGNPDNKDGNNGTAASGNLLNSFIEDAKASGIQVDIK